MPRILVTPLLLLLLVLFIYGSFRAWGWAPFAVAAAVALTRPWLDAASPSLRAVRSVARGAA